MTRRDRAIFGKAVFAAQRTDEAVERLVEAVGELVNIAGYSSFDLDPVDKLAVAVRRIYAQLKQLARVRR